MKETIYLIIAVVAVLLSTAEAKAQATAVYNANGQYIGYQQTGSNGVTSTYTPSGMLVGSQQIDNGQTNYYGSQGRYIGSTAPVYIAPNSQITVPREVPQVPNVRGF